MGQAREGLRVHHRLHLEGLREGRTRFDLLQLALLQLALVLQHPSPLRQPRLMR